MFRLYFSIRFSPFAFPSQHFDQNELLECIRKLVEVEKEWVPYSTTASLYIRPTLIGTEVKTLSLSPHNFWVLRHEGKASTRKGEYTAVTRQQYCSSGANRFYFFTSKSPAALLHKFMLTTPPPSGHIDLGLRK